MPGRADLEHQGTFAKPDEASALLGKKDAKGSAIWAKLRTLFLIVGWIAIGVGAACYFEGWGVLTSLYVIVQIITTIGYGDITVSSEGAKVFCGVYVVITVCLLGTLVTDLIDSFVKTNQEMLRAKLRQVQSKLHADLENEEDAKAKFGNTNELVTSAFIFLVFVALGTCFYATYESCSCSYGRTRIDGCVEGDKCAATGGVEKSWIDAFYMSLITLTTVGFGDHSPVSVTGRAVGCIWMLFGVVACANFVSSFSQMMLASNKEQKRLERVSKDLFNKIDKNNDGTLSRLEFRTYALIKFGLVTEDDMNEIDDLFHAIDKDGSGALSYSEIQEHCDS